MAKNWCSTRVSAAVWPNFDQVFYLDQPFFAHIHMDRRLAGASSVLAKGSGHFWGGSDREEVIIIRRKRKVNLKPKRGLETPVKTKKQQCDKEPGVIADKIDDQKSKVANEGGH